MFKLLDIINKKERIVIGLMSGTSVDGIDAVICKISGKAITSKVNVLAFKNYPFPNGIANRIFELFEEDTSSSKAICHMNVLLGQLFAKAALDIAREAGISIQDVDIIGSHGQTIYHLPECIEDCGFKIRSTLQIGEGSVIADRTGVLTVSNFREADMAANGLGAPLVPYTDYLLYRSPVETVALQNIGGVGNITVLPKGKDENSIIAFDTGPGNMIIDMSVYMLTNGEKRYDDNGRLAEKGNVCSELIEIMLDDNYFKLHPPKTTGREYFGKKYTEWFLAQCKQMGLNNYDIIMTATEFTAKSIQKAINDFVPYSIDKLIISGGGSYNETLVNRIKVLLTNTPLVLTGEQAGYNSDAKEAVAFALLANETINLSYNNVPSATGANKRKILGKINF